MGKHEFYNEGKSKKKIKSHFWPEKYINMGLQYTKRCKIATFGGIFLRNVDFFSQYFHENINITNFWDYNRLYCNSKNLKILIFSWKYWERKKITFLCNIAILHLLVYCVPILIWFSGQKWDIKNFRFSQIKKIPFFPLKPKKGWHGENNKA